MRILLLSAAIGTVMIALLVSAWDAHPGSNPPGELSNPDFESGSSPWYFYLNEDAGKVSATDGRDGSKCLVMQVHKGMGLDGFSQWLGEVAGRTVRVQAQVKSLGADVEAWVYIEFDRDSEKRTISTSSAPAPRDGAWHELSCELFVPPDIDRIRIFGRVEGTAGHAWFDNFEVEREQP